MSSPPVGPSFSPLAEWLFRIIPICIAVAGFFFTMITRYENRRRLTIRWASTLMASTAHSSGVPSVVIGIHNTGKRNVSLVEDSYYLYANTTEYYIKALDPKVIGRRDFAGLLHEGDSFKISIGIADLIQRVMEPETGISKGDIIKLTIRFCDVEGKKYASSARYSISGWGLIDRDDLYRDRLKAAKQSKKSIRKRMKDSSDFKTKYEFNQA